MLGDIDIEKLHYHKNPSSIDNVDIDKTWISNKSSSKNYTLLVAKMMKKLSHYI